ncbi:MAG: alpha/beta fold hydrolase [Nanoarchaeota archaeon]|nr:alpha/beta fold hydrolase [Nanoarchaeota archaeon]MBU4351683.1 alpha/beta fold hydrolase [Nanoarchaeota archaeon]MBU4456257.1 alpha/beta fold hydrolase [Nanoarchaeota archaeon]
MLKRLKNIILIVVIVFLLLFFVSRNVSEKTDWSVDFNGILKYPQDRGKVEVDKIFMEETDSYKQYKVVYKSRNKDIFGLLFLPKDKKDVPALIMLPGANGAKENHLFLGKKMADLGYAFLTIDQRGIGETDGTVKTMEEDFQTFFRNEEPILHLMIYDVLKAFDVLRNEKIVDKDKIIVSGESMGARFAVIAAALDPRIKGTLIFSSMGYGMYPTTTTEQKFFASINPDMYIDKISPRKLVFFHAEKDSVVPYEGAQQTFAYANEPKEFITMLEPCDHGYCDQVYNQFLEKLNWILE